MKKLKVLFLSMIAVSVLLSEANAQIKVFQRYKNRQHREMGYPDGRGSAGAFKRGHRGEIYKWGVGAEPVLMQALDPLDASFNYGTNLYGIYNIATKFALELDLMYFLPLEHTIFSIPAPYDMSMTSKSTILSADLNTKFTFLNDNGSDFHMDAIFGGCYMMALRTFKVSDPSMDTTFERSSNLIYVNAGFCTNLKVGPGFLRLSTIVGFPVYNSSPVEKDFSTLMSNGSSGGNSFIGVLVPTLPSYGSAIFYKIALGYRLMF